MNSMSAIVGASVFSTSSVSAQLTPSTTLPGKTQLTITGYSGSKTLTVIITDYNTLHGAKKAEKRKERKKKVAGKGVAGDE